MLKGKDFGVTSKGEAIKLFTLKNTHGVSVAILNLGGAIQAFHVPDKQGNLVDIVLGYDEGESYEENPAYLGAIVGRVVNRLSGTQVTIGEQTYPLATDETGLYIHSGGRGTFNQLFEVVSATGEKLVLKTVLADRQDDLPGNLTMYVTYHLTNQNEFRIEYQGTCDQQTLFMPTSHSYFNLSGHLAENLAEHDLMIEGDYYMIHDSLGLPTGEISCVDETVFDFRQSAPIHERLISGDEALTPRRGYDNNFMLNGTGYRQVAILTHQTNGISLACYTDQPCLQLYTSGFLENIVGKTQQTYSPGRGLCLETQHAPNSPRMPWLKSIVLNPGKEYYSKTTYKII